MPIDGDLRSCALPEPDETALPGITPQGEEMIDGHYGIAEPCRTLAEQLNAGGALRGRLVLPSQRGDATRGDCGGTHLSPRSRHCGWTVAGAGCASERAGLCPRGATGGSAASPRWTAQGNRSLLDAGAAGRSVRDERPDEYRDAACIVRRPRLVATSPHERLSHPVIGADGAHGAVAARTDPDMLDERFGRPRAAGPPDLPTRDGDGQVSLAQ